MAAAQESASITGVVTDGTGAVVPGVTVTLLNTATGVTYKATTNTAGSYLLTSVAPGPGYKIAFSRDGFQSYSANNLYLNVRATRTQNATLKVGGSEQTVQVSADSDTVTLNTTDATVGNNFQVSLVNELPVAMRDNPSALFYQQAGVAGDMNNTSKNDNAISVTGSRDDQTSATLDGLDVNDMATGQFGSIVGGAPVDSVQEFRGTTAGDQANSGQGSGGHFDMVTKSGTNQFHGNLNEYHRDTAMTANDWFNKNTTPKTARTPLIRNQFGGNIGGPILKNKAFFFFDYSGRRDIHPSAVTRTVPTTTFKAGYLGYRSTSGSINYLDSTAVAALDPSRTGFNAQILKLFKDRYPDPNTTSQGNGYNTSGYRFNASAPLNESIFVTRLDYTLTPRMTVFARFTINRMDTVNGAIQFPGDPETKPELDRSHAWVVGHTWAISDTKTNNISFGETVSDLSFLRPFNPQGVNQYTFGTTSSGSSILDQPYATAINAQARVYPTPQLRDDFTWIKGRHNLQFGGTFKFINPDSSTDLDYDEPYIGIGGLVKQLDSAQHPADFRSSTYASFDPAFTTALGRYANQETVYNYNASGKALTLGTMQTNHYRYFETELYVQDSWKVNPSLTLNYGVRWVNYTVPYDKNGVEAAPNLGFDAYWADRLTQSAAASDTLPYISYDLSGKANGKPGMFNPQRHNFAPHVGFVYVPTFDKKTTISGGFGVDYDRTVVSSLLYQQAQHTYLFKASNLASYGSSNGATASLTGDSRFAGIGSNSALTAPTMSHPYTPFVSGGAPNGLANGQAFNTAIDHNFKTPYSMMVTFGLQHEFPMGFLWKANYVGRFGRRLMAQADANQLIDFPDKVSGQKMSEAVSTLEKQVRTGATPTAQPWFENVAYTGATADVVNNFSSLLQKGDFADLIQAMASYGLLPNNVGMGSQFSEFTYYTNKGFSNYHGFLTTLHKNVGYGLQFDVNYTWSRSIDNVSVDANSIASSGYGFICDVNRPRECRAPSDFDIAHVLNGDFIYESPVGRGRTFGATMPLWLDEITGGWTLSGMPTWHTGYPFFARSSAYVAGYSNNAPAVVTGNMSDLKVHVNKDSSGNVWLFKDATKAVNSYEGPTGFEMGARNNLRGPSYFNFDLGLSKTFPLYKNSAHLKLRGDAFNVLNHPSFDIPTANTYLDITQSSGNFGQVNDTVSTSRVLQVALRLEF